MQLRVCVHTLGHALPAPFQLVHLRNSVGCSLCVGDGDRCERPRCQHRHSNLYTTNTCHHGWCMHSLSWPDPILRFHYCTTPPRVAQYQKRRKGSGHTRLVHTMRVLCKEQSLKRTHVEPHELRCFRRFALLLHVRQLDWLTLKHKRDSTVVHLMIPH